MLRANHLVGFGSDGNAASLTWKSSTTSLVDGAQYLQAVDRGRSSPDKYFVVAITVDSVTLGNTTVTVCTFTDGAFASCKSTKLAETTSANGALTSIWIIEPEVMVFGSSIPQNCTLEVDLSQGMQNCTIHIWEAIGINPVPTATYTDTTGNPSSFNMVCPAHSCTVCALTVDAIGSGTITWTNQTERFDSPVETSVHSVADSVQLVANASLAVSASHSGGATIHMLCGVVFQAAAGKFFLGG